MFFGHALVPLLCPFDCSRLNISPFEWYSKCWASATRCHCCSWDVPHKLQDKVLGKSWTRQCFVDWHILCVVQEFWGRYTGLIVPEDLFWKRVFQTAFLCQIVVQSLGKIFFWQCPFSFALLFGKHKHVAHNWTGVELAWVSITR